MTYFHGKRHQRITLFDFMPNAHMASPISKSPSTKPTILTFVRYYIPGYKSGGPIRTIANLVEHLGDRFHFLVVTSDRDATDLKPYSNVKINSWNAIHKAHVFYVSPRNQSITDFSQLIRKIPYDVLYLNSFFDPTFTFYPLLLRISRVRNKKPTILAPRGELSKGALSLKVLKKRLFLLFAHYLPLYRNLIWQASSEYEASDIRKVMGRMAKEICVAPNLPSFPDLDNDGNFVPRRDGDPLRIVFLSRISPMKNLDFALKVLSQVKVPVAFTIYGPIRDDSYWKKCQEIAAQLPKHVRVAYVGPVESKSVFRVLSSHDLFFLPTRGENFGHVIIESLYAGTPVLISDRTPWHPHDVEACINIPLDNVKDFVDAIERFSEFPPKKLLELRKIARSTADILVSRDYLVEQNVRLFNFALNRKNV